MGGVYGSLSRFVFLNVKCFAWWLFIGSEACRYAMKTKRKKTDAHRNVPGWKTGYLGFRIIVQVSFTHLFIDVATIIKHTLATLMNH